MDGGASDSGIDVYGVTNHPNNWDIPAQGHQSDGAKRIPGLHVWWVRGHWLLQGLRLLGRRLSCGDTSCKKVLLKNPPGAVTGTEIEHPRVDPEPLLKLR